MSLASACNVSEYLSGYLGKLIAEASEEQMAQPAGPGANPPAWIVGHLCVVNDHGLMLLGGAERVSPPAWHEMFGSGSTPPADAGEYPSKSQLVSTFHAGHEQFVTVARHATINQLSQPFRHRFFVNTSVTTVGDAATLLLTSHLGLHLGQLSMWRRLQGLPPLF